MGGPRREEVEHKHRREMGSRLLPHVLMLFVGVSFAGYNVLLTNVTHFPNDTPKVVAYCSQSAFMLYRIGGAAVVFVVAGFAGLLGQMQWPVDHWHAGHLALQGICGIFLNQYLFLLGVGHTTANDGAVFAAATPVVVVVLAIIVKLERLTWRKALGVVLGVLGALITLGLSVFHGGQSDQIGIIILSSCMLAGATYCLLLRYYGLAPKYRTLSASQQTMWQYVVGGICMAATSAFCYEEPSTFASPGPAGWLTWTAVAYAILIASGLNYWIMTWAARYLEASTIGMYGLVQPFATALIQYVCYGTPVAIQLWLGMTLVAVSLLMLGWQSALDNVADKESKQKLSGAGAAIHSATQPLISAPINSSD